MPERAKRPLSRMARHGSWSRRYRMIWRPARRAPPPSPGGHQRSARHSRRPAALHQPGRHGTGHVHRHRAIGPKRACRSASTRSAAFRLPGKHPEQRFAMFAYPWDLPHDIAPWSMPATPAGTEATGRFWFKLFPKKFRVRDLRNRRRLSGQGGQSDRSHRHNRSRPRSAVAVPEDQRRDAP